MTLPWAIVTAAVIYAVAWVVVTKLLDDEGLAPGADAIGFEPPTRERVGEE